MTDRALPNPATSTRGRIIGLLQRGPRTARELAAELELSYHAVRLHLLALDRDGVIRIAGEQRGPTRPAVVYELAPGSSVGRSQAYVPFAAQLMGVLGDRLPKRQRERLMREVGERLAAFQPPITGSLTERVEAAAAFLERLGATIDIERERTVQRIRSYGCILEEVVHDRPDACIAMASFLSSILDADVQERCERGERPRCCFEVRRAG